MLRFKHTYQRSLIALLIVAINISCEKVDVPQTVELNTALEVCAEKIKTTVKTLGNSESVPKVVRSSDIHWSNSGINSWTSGFWSGMLWYMYDYTGDDYWLNHAKYYTNLLEPIRRLPWKTHDLGFMMYTSYGHGYRSTRDPVYREYLLETADSLATLYNPNVGTIHSWPWMKRKKGWSHTTIIDNVMNLELLFWASKNGGDKRLCDIAVEHAKTTQRDFIRPDYGTWQVVVYDSLTGKVVEKVTDQGYNNETVWARGQAWALYGFVMCYRESKQEEFLEASQGLADYFIDNLPDDFVPYWDFMAPGIPNEVKDASAAAIAASALVELSTLANGDMNRSTYRRAAESVLASLASEEYQSSTNDAILRHCVGSKPGNSEVDVSLVYADYYYLEALIRLKNLQKAEQTAGM
jgi:unsaturated chondroitin disaccharide hydrolase